MHLFSGRIGIIGAGMIGGTLADLWSRSGIDVMLSSRHPERISPPAGVRIGSSEEASSYGEVVLLAVPFGAPAHFSTETKANMIGKVVLDANNPIPGRDGSLASEATVGGAGSGLWTASQLPGARVVKAFNTVYFRTMLTNYGARRPIAVPLASDDQEALDVAERLVEAAGMSPVIVGALEKSALFDPGTAVWNSNATVDEVRELLGL